MLMLIRHFRGVLQLHRRSSWNTSQATRKESKYQGEVASEYLSRRAATLLWQHENILLARLLSELPNNLKVLDAPFGTGRAMPIYAAKQWAITGLDISLDMLRIGSRYSEPYEKIRLEQGDAAAIRHGDAEFEGVVSMRFLGGIPPTARAEKILSEFSRVASDFVVLQLRFLKEGSPRGTKDNMGSRWTEREMLDRLGSKGLVVKQMVATSDSLNRKDVLVLCRHA